MNAFSNEMEATELGVSYNPTENSPHVEMPLKQSLQPSICRSNHGIFTKRGKGLGISMLFPKTNDQQTDSYNDKHLA